MLSESFSATLRRKRYFAHTSGRLEHVAKLLLSTGVTSFLPTLISSPPALYQELIPRFAQLRRLLGDGDDDDAAGGGARDGGGGRRGRGVVKRLPQASTPRGKPRPPSRARVLGLHLEGPFMNEAKKGAHKAEYMRAPKLSGGGGGGGGGCDLGDLLEVYGSLEGVKLVTLAPELAGALGATRGLAAAGVVVSMGHTLSTFDEGVAGVRAGARLITHLFNAMPAFHHRDPGLVGLLGAAAEDRCCYSLIADGLHAHAASVREALVRGPRIAPRAILVVTARRVFNKYACPAAAAAHQGRPAREFFLFHIFCA